MSYYPKHNAADYPTPDDEEKALARDGQLIDAIKLYRARTGYGLAEAKCACDVYYVPPPYNRYAPPPAERITKEEIDELFSGKSREEQLELALRQMLGTFDTPIARAKFRGGAYQEAIDLARRVLPFST
jgi:hypothetical protein